MPTFDGSFDTTPVVLVGLKSMRVDSTASPFRVTSTQSLGDLSAYTLVGSGAPTSGTVGLWVFVSDPSSLSSALTLKIGSSSGNYSSVAAVRTITDGWDLQAGWNYLVFRLKNATTTGTPNWTSVAYVDVSFTSASNQTIYLDYFTIGKGDIIGLNGLGSRYTAYTITTYNY